MFLRERVGAAACGHKEGGRHTTSACAPRRSGACSAQVNEGSTRTDRGRAEGSQRLWKGVRQERSVTTSLNYCDASQKRRREWSKHFSLNCRQTMTFPDRPVALTPKAPLVILSEKPGPCQGALRCPDCWSGRDSSPPPFVPQSKVQAPSLLGLFRTLRTWQCAPY